MRGREYADPERAPREHVGTVTGVILAGGRSRRFSGVNKALLEIDGERIIDRQLHALRDATVEQLIVADDPSPYEALGVRVLPDARTGVGPMGGLLTALRASNTSRVLVLACDLPFVHASFLQFLVRHAPDADVVVPQTAGGLHPLCAVYATRLRDLVAARVDDGRLAMHALFDAALTVVVGPTMLAGFDPDGRLLANINSPSDYDAARTSRTGTAPDPRDSR
jgi:molybdopterin-guanine dinucleotide biosynthesis protein A